MCPPGNHSSFVEIAASCLSGTNQSTGRRGVSEVAQMASENAGAFQSHGTLFQASQWTRHTSRITEG